MKETYFSLTFESQLSRSDARRAEAVDSCLKQPCSHEDTGVVEKSIEKYIILLDFLSGVTRRTFDLSKSNSASFIMKSYVA